jgi:RimJ/RimL family protein N-acetyltransferase
VLGVGLLPAWRGQGVGERLMRPALEAARALGLSRVELRVRADNERAISLYRKLGFVLEGRCRRATRVDNEFYDVIIMGLLFETPSLPPGHEAARG